MPGFKTDAERKGDTEVTIELEHKKVTTCLQIIHKYNCITAQCVNEGLPAAEVQRRLFEEIPDLGRILNLLAESDTSSNMTDVDSDYSDAS